MKEKIKEFKQEYLSVVFDIYRPFKNIMLTMLGFLAMAQIINLVQPYLYGCMIDAVVSKRNLKGFVVLAVIWIAVKVINNVWSFIKDAYELKYFDYAIHRCMNVVSLSKIFSFSIGQHQNQHSGVKQDIIRSGQHSLSTMAYMLCYEFVPMIFQTLFAICALFYFNFLLGAIVLFGTLFYTVVCYKLNKSIQPDLKIQDEDQKESSKKYSEILRNVALVMTNARQKTVSEDFLDHYDVTSARARKLWTRYTFWAHVRWLIISVTEFAVILLSVFLVYKGKFTTGNFITCLFWTGNAFGRLNNFSNMQRQLLKVSASVKKFIDMMKIESDIKIPENPQRPKISGRVVFDDVSFKYPARLKEGEETSETQSKEALSRVSFAIEPGQKVAFVGHSGAGKSTIINLLLRAYDPSEGKISVDGVDLKEMDLNFYHRNIGMVEQHVELFDNTLRYNIAFGLNSEQPIASDDQLEWVTKASCITKFFHRLEHGLDTIIGEKGVKLSGGERQRVGIARALIKKPKILVFDEATSNLDAENEALIHKAIREASKGRTTIIIAHRLSTIMDADKIFVFHEGQIISAGTHNVLLQECSKYQNLINSQVANI